MSSEVIGNFLLQGEVLDRLVASSKLRQIELSRGLGVFVGIKECSHFRAACEVTPWQLDLLLDGTPITSVDTFKYLGVVLDSGR